jgi:Flp pilus assembly protein TadD
MKLLGDRLGVAAVLGASVRREGPRVRITARLTDTATGYTLWSHTYDRAPAGIFDTQSDIAEEVVHALLGSIPDGGEALAKRLTPTRNEAAFDTYLQGLQLLRRAVQTAAADQAVARFGQALKQDTGFAKAQAGICRAEIWRFQSQHSPAAFDNAKAACQRAEQMDPALAETDLALGDLYRAAGDPERALQHYRKAAQSPVHAAQAHVGMAKIYATQEHSDLALAEFQRALQLDPGSAGVHAELGYQQFLDGKLPQAVASYRRAVELRPDSAELWGALGSLYIAAGNDAAAEAALEHAIGIEPAVDTLTNLGLLKYQHGDYAEAVALQRQATTLDSGDFMVWSNLAVALRADPASSAADTRQAFTEAAARAESYLKLKPDDARAVAELGLYRANLGDATAARQLVARAEALRGQPDEVALLNAETLALLGDLGAARQRLLASRAAGMAETRIAGNYTFRRLGLVSPTSTAGQPGSTEPPAPHSTAGLSTGG